MSTDTPTPWWDTEDHDDVTGDRWITKHIHTITGKPDIFVTATTDHLGHTYVVVDVPALPALPPSEARLVRVALDRAIALADRIEREVTNLSAPSTSWTPPDTVEPDDIYAMGREDGQSMYE